jgi:hypothetical protein
MLEKISSGSATPGLGAGTGAGAEGTIGGAKGGAVGGVGGGGGTEELARAGGGVSGSNGRFAGGFIVLFTEYMSDERIAPDQADYTPTGLPHRH